MPTTELTAGRELDAQIAEQVFGRTLVARDWPCGWADWDDGGEYQAAGTRDAPAGPGWTKQDATRWRARYPDRGPVYADPDDPRPYTPVPFYSREIAAAWQVVEAMIALVEATQATATNLEWRGPLYKPSHHYLTAEGYPLGTVCWYVHVERFGWQRCICAETPMLAICRAALAVQSAAAVRPPDR